jgi:hypothetical protein
MKKDCVMKTMWQSPGKMSTCLVLLLVSLPFDWSTTSAQSTGDSSVCVRENVPLNLKQEPFIASIAKAEIKQCLQANKLITNHHIVFEDYRDAWQELAKETGKYDIPLLIDGGVLHANFPYNEQNGTGGIGLWVFRDRVSKSVFVR